MTNLTPLRNFINEPHCDLGANAWKLADLVRTMKNARFIDLGVRLGGYPNTGNVFKLVMDILWAAIGRRSIPKQQLFSKASYIWGSSISEHSFNLVLIVPQALCLKSFISTYLIICTF